MILAFLAILLVGLGVGLPIAVALILPSWIYALIRDVPINVVAHAMVNSLDSWALLAVPFYILMGELMSRGGVTHQLTEFALALVGRFRGALAYAAALSGVLLAGVSGSATADAAALGGTLIPAMRKKSYSPGFAAAVIGSAAIIGPIIPPSIPMVVFASLAEVSVGRLFLAGVMPGLLMAVLIAGTTFVIVRRRNYGPSQPFDLGLLRRSAVRVVPAFGVPGIVVAGLVLGYFTATESGVMAVLAAIIAGALCYRELTFRGAFEAGNSTIIMTGAAMFMVAASAGVGKILAIENAGIYLSSMLVQMSGGEAWLLLLYLNIFLLLIGTFMEPLPMIILLTPILVPIFTKLGIDAIHLGVVMILNLMIGMLTPPVGVVMFIVMGIAGISMREFMREGWPFLLALIIVLFVITYIPQTVLWLPNLLMPAL